MAVQPLVKGENDWHKKVNANFADLEGQVREVAEQASQAASGKVDKPTKQTLTEGYLYQDALGKTVLVDGGEQAGKFKYTIIVDNGSDGSPKAIEYADDCAGFIEASASDLGDWGKTKLVREYFRPCVIRPGDSAPAYYLQQNNMSLKENGKPAVLTGADGDVMIEIHKLYGSFTNVGNKCKISVMNYKEDDNCFCFNDIGGVEKDVVYRGVFKAGVFSGATSVMRSISGVVPLTSISRELGRTWAKARGTGYHQNNFFMLMLYQVMYLLMYKNKDSQSALGQGRSSSANTEGKANTGWSITKPFCWGDQGGVNGVKFLGVEDFYGNVQEWVDGVCFINQVYKVTRDPEKYNGTGAGMEISVAVGLSEGADEQYITKCKLTNDLGFLPAAVGGSSSTHWCDSMWLDGTSQAVSFGGPWDGAVQNGAFNWYMDYADAEDDWFIGSRLCRG